MSIRITCINKENGYHEDPHVAISMLGWLNEGTNEAGKSTRIDMYNWIKQGGQAYVRDTYGNNAYLVAKISEHGNPYVQTVADGRPANNLLSLLECR